VRGHTYPQPATQRRGWPPPRERGHLFTGRHQCNNKGPATGRLCSAAVADGHLTEGMPCSAVLCLSGVVAIQGVEVSAGETGYPLGFPDNTIDGDGPRGPASRLPRAGYSAAEEERGRTGHRSAQRGGGPISRPQ